MTESIRPGRLKIVDLRKDELFISQYVELRNSYADLLLTKPVEVGETKKWLTREDVEVRCLVDNGVLIGAVIIYLNKENEIAFFVKDRNRGIGNQLLRAIEEVARERKLNGLWAWVLSSNTVAQKSFMKNGYLLEEKTQRRYNDKTLEGFIFTKKLI